MAMNDMLADILKKAIPPEVMALLSEEKIKELGAQAKMAVDNLNARLTAIELSQTKILEFMENDNGNSKRGSKRLAIGNAKDDGNGKGVGGD